MTAISDTSPLVALANAGLLRLLPELFSDVVIPEAVALEAIQGRPDASDSRAIMEVLDQDWLSIVTVAESETVDLGSIRLGRGESEAIALALNTADGVLIVDDLAARRAAIRFNLPVIGTVGVLVAARESGLIEAVAPVLDQLKVVGFRISPALIEAAIKGELE